MADAPAARPQETTLLAGLDIGSARSVAPRTRAEQLAAAVDAHIQASGAPPGAPVGTIEEIRLQTGFARATVNEAVRLLADRDVLVVRPGRRGGLFVADQGPVVRMRRTLLSARENASAVADAVELRNHLEELIDVGAARFCEEADITQLRARLADMEAALDWAAFVRANWALHEQLAGLCPNTLARAVYVGALGYLSAATPQLDGGEGDSDAAAYRARRLQIHVDLVDAVAAGDEGAVRVAVARHNI